METNMALVNDKKEEQTPTGNSDHSFEENTETWTPSSDKSDSSLKDIKDDLSQNTEEDLSDDLDTPISSTKDELKVEPDTSAGQKSPTFRHKDGRESSPLKEAIRGFVLSKLSKKPGATDSSNAPDSDKRTLFSGIKERIVKKLEDSSVKDIPIPKEEIVTQEESKEPVTTNGSRCEVQELKSVVANDHNNIALPVEEAEECFEELKITVSAADDTSYDYALPSTSISTESAKGTPRSKTMSNIVGSCQSKLKPKLMPDKNLSISFSSLQKSERENEANSIDSLLENDPVISREPLTDILQNVPVRSTSASDNMNNPQQEQRSQSSTNPSQNGFNNVLNGHLQRAGWLDVLVVIVAVCTYFLFYTLPFLSGVLFGMLIMVLTWLVYSEVVHALTVRIDKQSPMAYKTLPPLTMPVAKHRTILEHEGWINQLFGGYDHKTHKISDAVSVYVRIRDSKMFLSYPKKDVPRRAMWNEKQLHTTNNSPEERFSLKDAQISLLPPGIGDTRIWNKKYPICIVLIKEPRPRATSLDSGTRHLEKGTVLPVRTASHHQQHQPHSSSLHNTPVRGPINEGTFYFFPRTDREKEEWYWKFQTASKWETIVASLDVSKPKSSFESTSILETDSTQGSATSTQLSGKTEELKIADTILKPTLDFDCYMYYLIKEQLVHIKAFESSQSCVHWLNVFLGRLFFDFLSKKQWADKVMERVQMKLDRLKMPPYMQKLVVTDVYLGTSLPHIHKASDAILDERGIWIDFDIKYEGFFQMTLETKFKSLKWVTDRVPVPDSVEKLLEHDLNHELRSESIAEELNEDWDEDEDMCSETSKEESPVHHPTLSTKLLQSVEKWVVSSNFTENSFVKRCVDQVTQARLVLTVEISSLEGTLAVNFPPLPTNRIWYGFRTNPELSLNVFPKVGARQISLVPIIQFIKRRLLIEFQRAVVMPNMDDFTIPLMHSELPEQ